MALRDYLPIDKEDIPEKFEIDIEDSTYIIRINYNQTSDFYTIDLWDNVETPIVLGEKLVLNQPLWSGIVDGRLPAPTLIPMDVSGQTKRISVDNFYVTVFVYFDDILEESEPTVLDNNEDDME